MRRPAIPITYSRTPAPNLTQCDLIRQFGDTAWDSEARIVPGSSDPVLLSVVYTGILALAVFYALCLIRDKNVCRISVNYRTTETSLIFVVLRQNG